jgi:hypothetical protein
VKRKARKGKRPRLGDRVPHYGRIDAMLWISGERYFMLTDGNCVSLMPAEVIERLRPAKRKGRERGK